MNITNFRVDYDKCIGCGLCEKVCPGGILHLNTEHKCEMDRLAAKDVYPKGFDKPSYVLDKKLAVQCLPVLGGNAPRQKR